MVTAVKDFLKVYWPFVLVAVLGVIVTLMLNATRTCWQNRG